MSKIYLDREMIFQKLVLLGTFIGHMGSKENCSNFEKDDFLAMQSLLNGIADEIYPEHKQAVEMVE